jgi:hypothetical protein
VVCLLLSVSYIGICACVSYLYRSFICLCVRYLLRSCVSGAEHGSTYKRSFCQVPGSFAGDALDFYAKKNPMKKKGAEIAHSVVTKLWAG